MEKGGVPTVALNARTFDEDFRTSCKLFGVPGIPFVDFSEQSLGPMAPEEIVRKAQDQGLIDAIVDKLTNQGVVGEKAATKQTVSLGKTLFDLDVPQVEVFEGKGELEAWRQMAAVYQERGWGDGFPLVPPTPEAVAEMLKGTKRSPKDVVAVLEPCFGIATVEKIAINAVMAGCKPAHLPVVIAAVEAMSDPLFELRHVTMSTSPYTPMLVVNGPITKKIGMNSGMACLGPGAVSAVNTAIGRAIRLILIHVAGNFVGITDMDTLGETHKYSMCIAEREEVNPWQPLHVERGYSKDDSTVTVFNCYAAITHADHFNTEPGPFIRRLAGLVSAAGLEITAGWMTRSQKDINTCDLKPEDYEEHCLIILCPNHVRMLAYHNITKPGFKELLHMFARVPIRDMPGFAGNALMRYGKNCKVLRDDFLWLSDYPDTLVPAYAAPSSYQVVVAGADSNKSMAVIGGKVSITRKIEQ